MNILIVSHEYPPIGGGGANACMFLAKEYVLAGHRVCIVTAGFGDLPSEENITNGRIRIYRVKCKRKNKTHCGFSEMFDYMMKASRFCSTIARKEHFDVCQIFFGIPSGPIGYKLKKRYGIPFVIRLGGGDIPGFQKRFAFLYKLIGIPLKRIWKNADAIVANSKGLRKFALDFYDKCDVKVIHNGVDANTFSTGQLDSGGDCEKDKIGACPTKEQQKLKLLFVSRLIERKGLQFILPHLKEIEQQSGKSIQLIVVGDGPYRGVLESIARNNHVEDMISFEGQKDKGELVSYYRNSDVFVFPSMREGMPNVVLEAMASGLPIVMMKKCEGAEELVNQNGHLVEGEFHEELALFLKKSKEEISDMGRLSRERVIEEFSWEKSAMEYLDILQV